jgi:hypothetical protein
MKKAGTFKLIENWKLSRVDSNTGEVLSTKEICNTIVNVGLERMARLCIGNSSTTFKALAIGTGATAVTNSDTALQTEFIRALATLTYVASYKAHFNYRFIFGTGVSEVITEAGIFDSATVSGSTMLARTTFAGETVGTGIDFIVDAEITFARA